ncbi:MAG: efflux RND transporter periplasmic adaptor subunit, partial [Ginsengibacter sp.]
MVKKIIPITIIALLLFACSNKKQPANNNAMPGMKIPARAAGGDSAAKQDGMANMPGMAKANDTANNDLKLSDQQIQLGNIQTDTVNIGMLGDKIVLTATLNIDEKKTTSVSARVMGRIEKLYFKNSGDYVKKGDNLYDLYSEDLNNAKQELILALQQKNTLDNTVIDFNQLIQSAKYKLLLWGMSDSQIDELVKTKKTTPITTFYSNASGYITMLEVKEGDYTMEGST